MKVKTKDTKKNLEKNEKLVVNYSHVKFSTVSFPFIIIYPERKKGMINYVTFYKPLCLIIPNNSFLTDLNWCFFLHSTFSVQSFNQKVIIQSINN